jgi:multiple sugar transport system substrate-binding protein
MYTGLGVSMEGFLPAVSPRSVLVAADPVEAWLKVLDSCQFYPTAKSEWIDGKQGVIEVEQVTLLGGDVKTLLNELQAKVTQ